MEQPLMLQSDCVDCPFYDGFGQCIQYGNITEEIISKCEFNNKVMKANEAPEKIYLYPSDRAGEEYENEWGAFPWGEGSVEYVLTDAFIEKAEKFFIEKFEVEDYNDNIDIDGSPIFNYCRFIEDLKTYMKGE